MYRVWIAVFTGQIGGGRTGGELHLVLLCDDPVHRECDRCIVEIGNSVDTVTVEPLAGGRNSDIGLLLMISGKDFDLKAVLLRPEILDCLLRGDHRGRTGIVAILPREVGQHADPNGFPGSLSAGAAE